MAEALKLATTKAEIAAAFSRLPSCHRSGRQRTWIDRVDTFEGFMANGPTLAESFRADRADLGRATVDKMRRMAPELFDLLMRAFPAEQRW
jgi:hypothetical protein